MVRVSDAVAVYVLVPRTRQLESWKGDGMPNIP